MSPTESQELFKAGKAILVDVREDEELRESGTAEGALWMPTSKICDDDPEWTAFKANLPKDKKVILFCRSGNRSGRVAEFLRCEGYDTENAGGFKDWVAAGLPVRKFP